MDVEIVKVTGLALLLHVEIGEAGLRPMVEALLLNHLLDQTLKFQSLRIGCPL